MMKLAFCIPGLVAVTAAIASGPMFAEVIEGRLYISDSTDDRILSFTDVDASDAWEPDTVDVFEVFYDDSGEGPDLSVPSHLHVDESGTVFLLDGGTIDRVLTLVDLNGDGDANDAGESSDFYSGAEGAVPFRTPNTLVRCSDGSFLVADDGSTAGHLVRLHDRNGNGNALDVGEARVVFDSTNRSGIQADDPESVVESADGTIYVADSTLRAILALRDEDGDGTFQGVGEARIWYQADEAANFNDLDSLVLDGAGRLFVGDEDSGTVWVLRDRNGDGDAVDENEASVYVDASADFFGDDLNDMVLLPGGELLLLDGSVDSVAVAYDRNGDGDANDEEETRRWLLDEGETLATPSAVALSSVPSEPPAGRRFVRGDTNFDGTLGMDDAIFVTNFLFLGGVSGDCLDALDADDNGVVEISDPVHVLRYLFSGGTSPLPPFPVAGTDPSADGLSCR